MYKVREAIPTDSSPVCSVLRRSITEVCAPDYNDQSIIDEWLSNKTEANIMKWIQSPNTYSVVCVGSNNDIVGFGLTTLKGEILLIYLVPEALYQGNGRLMLKQMENRIINEGINEIRTTSSVTAKAFYERNGFIEDGPPKLVGNIEGDFPLIKILSPNKSLNSDAPR
jgi:hypothetical protein